MRSAAGHVSRERRADPQTQDWEISSARGKPTSAKRVAHGHRHTGLLGTVSPSSEAPNQGPDPHRAPASCECFSWKWNQISRLSRCPGSPSSEESRHQNRGRKKPGEHRDDTGSRRRLPNMGVTQRDKVLQAGHNEAIKGPLGEGKELLNTNVQSSRNEYVGRIYMDF